MNLDELAKSISETKLKENLLRWVNEWKNDEEDIDQLACMISKWQGKVWFEDSIESIQFHTQFQEFKAIAIDRIDGLTVNERLYLFGLFEQWDRSNEEERLRIRCKIKANI